MKTINTSAKPLFTYDHIKQTIVGSERSFKLAGIPGSDAYDALEEVKAGQPTYTLFPIPSKHKVAKKQTYKGMNLELMAFHLDNNAGEDAKEEFTHMVQEKVAYPTIKSWFLDYFKAGFTVEKAMREIAYKKLNAKKSKVRKVVRANVVKAVPAVENPNAVNF